MNLVRLVMGLLPFHSGLSAKYRELKDCGTEGWATGPSIPPLSLGRPIQLVIETSTTGQKPPQLEGTGFTWHLL